jgi:hypothetical protein
MAHNEGALARQLDFGDEGGSGQRSLPIRPNRGLRLAVPSAVLRGPVKYKVLEHRRRQAQIKARKALDAAETLNFEG